MVDNNKEKVNSAENNDNSVSPEVLEEAKVYLAEEKAAEAREFIRDEEIKADGKFLHYTKVILSGILDQIFVIALALVVFGIFDLALKGRSKQEIVEELTNNNILTPSVYLKEKYNIKVSRISRRWNTKMLDTILQNKTGKNTL